MCACRKLAQILLTSLRGSRGSDRLPSPIIGGAFLGDRAATLPGDECYHQCLETRICRRHPAHSLHSPCPTDRLLRITNRTLESFARLTEPDTCGRTLASTTKFSKGSWLLCLISRLSLNIPTISDCAAFRGYRSLMPQPLFRHRRST